MKMRWILLLLAVGGAYLPHSQAQTGRADTRARAEPPSDAAGTAQVVDGDSLEIGGRRIRLHAVDAPEGRQTCTRAGRTWPCGEAAAAELRSLVAGARIECRAKDVDTYGRTVAVCRNGTTDLGGALVSAGLALAYRAYGTDYVDEEESARAARRGVWAGSFTNPWDYRHQDGADAAPSGQRAPAPPATDACRKIKGNINRQGERIYHVPGSRSYDETRIDPAKGERCFATVESAEAAGWRAPRAR
jgi:endonuclease YncB( thermonuclease family)